MWEFLGMKEHVDFRRKPTSAASVRGPQLGTRRFAAPSELRTPPCASQCRPWCQARLTQTEPLRLGSALPTSDCNVQQGVKHWKKKKSLEK